MLHNQIRGSAIGTGTAGAVGMATGAAMILALGHSWSHIAGALGLAILSGLLISPSLYFLIEKAHELWDKRQKEKQRETHKVMHSLEPATQWGEKKAS